MSARGCNVSVSGLRRTSSEARCWHGGSPPRTLVEGFNTPPTPPGPRPKHKGNRTPVPPRARSVPGVRGPSSAVSKLRPAQKSRPKSKPQQDRDWMKANSQPQLIPSGFELTRESRQGVKTSIGGLLNSGNSIIRRRLPHRWLRALNLWKWSKWLRFVKTFPF